MIRAGLVTAVAAGVNGRLIDRKIAYVTSDESFRTPFARSYRVVEELPYREKQLRAALRARGIGRLTIKKRGVDVVPEQLRRRLRPARRGRRDARADPEVRRGRRAPRRTVLIRLCYPLQFWGEMAVAVCATPSERTAQLAACSST